MEITTQELSELLNSRQKQVEGQTTKQAESNKGLCIVILDRAYIYVGELTLIPDEQLIRVDNAFNIRIWGTSKGLSELINGPTQTTIYDKTGTVLAPIKSLIHFILCNSTSKW